MCASGFVANAPGQYFLQALGGRHEFKFGFDYPHAITRNQTHRVDDVSLTYDGSGGRTHTIRYDGTLSEDGGEIEGRWIIQANWAGRFLMIRSGRAVPAEKVAALAKA